MNVAVFAMLIRPLDSYTRATKTCDENNKSSGVLGTCGVVNEETSKQDVVSEGIQNSENAINVEPECVSVEKYERVACLNKETGLRVGRNQSPRATRSTSLTLVSSITDVYTASLQQIASSHQDRSEYNTEKSCCHCVKTGTRFLDTSLLRNGVFLVYLATLFFANFSPLSIATILPSYAEYVSVTYVFL